MASVASSASPANPFHVVAGTGPEALAAITDRAVTLTVWERQPPVRLRGLGRFAEIRFAADADAVEAGLLERMRGPRRRWAEAVAADAGMLAGLYAAATGAHRLDVRLDRVSGNGCWRFHADYVGVRLISTYAGRGTQWLAQGDLDGGAPFELATGHVGLFKGRLLAGDAAIVHRSPPIAGTGEERLVLVIDPERPPLDAGA